MLRLVALALFVLLLWLVLEGALQVARRLASQARKGTMPRRPGPPAGPLDKVGEELVRCATCGVHVPRSRALPPMSASSASGPPADLYCSDRCWRTSPLAS